MADSRHSPGPWSYQYNPYTMQEGGNGTGAAGGEIPAFEVLDSEGNKVFNTNEDMPAGIQEANALLATDALKLRAENAVLREALTLAQRALNTAPRFRVGDTDSYKIAATVDKALALAAAGHDARTQAVPDADRTDARLIEAAPAQALLLDLVRYGQLSLGDGDLEFREVVYAFDERRPDWKAVVDAIGWDQARSAVAAVRLPDPGRPLPSPGRIALPEPQHTPGPWGDNDNGGVLGNLENYRGEAPVVAVVEGYDDDGNASIEVKANTALINASPRLLKVASASLKRMADIYRDTFDSRMDNDPLVIELRAAIAEATPGATLHVVPEPSPPLADKPLNVASDVYTALMTHLESAADEFARLASTPEQAAFAESFNAFVAGDAHTSLKYLTGLAVAANRPDAMADEIAIGWSIDDVHEVRPDLSVEQCREVLHRVEKHHDASVGITWDTIEHAAEDLFPAPDSPPPASGPADTPPLPSSITAALLDNPKSFLPDSGPGDGNDHGKDRGR